MIHKSQSATMRISLVMAGLIVLNTATAVCGKFVRSCSYSDSRG